jgi:hypothetical protein
MVSNILPVPYNICYDEAASYHMYHYPESLEAKCYPCFSYGKDGNPGTILIGVAHDMTCGSSPDAFDAADHGRLNHMAQATPANHAIAITAYLIFLRRDILDQVLAMLFPV